MQQTVQFACPHCRNVMAVGLALLGRSVRCPHCQQVSRAPASVEAAAATLASAAPAVSTQPMIQPFAPPMSAPQVAAPPMPTHFPATMPAVSTAPASTPQVSAPSATMPQVSTIPGTMPPSLQPTGATGAPNLAPTGIPGMVPTSVPSMPASPPTPTVPPNDPLTPVEDPMFARSAPPPSAPSKLPGLAETLLDEPNLGMEFRLPPPPERGEGHESIFGEPMDDDLFGEHRKPMKPELPVETTPMSGPPAILPPQPPLEPPLPMPTVKAPEQSGMVNPFAVSPSAVPTFPAESGNPFAFSPDAAPTPAMPMEPAVSAFPQTKVATSPAFAAAQATQPVAVSGANAAYSSSPGAIPNPPPVPAEEATNPFAFGVEPSAPSASPAAPMYPQSPAAPVYQAPANPQYGGQAPPAYNPLDFSPMTPGQPAGGPAQTAQPLATAPSPQFPGTGMPSYPGPAPATQENPFAPAFAPSFPPAPNAAPLPSTISTEQPWAGTAAPPQYGSPAPVGGMPSPSATSEQSAAPSPKNLVKNKPTGAGTAATGLPTWVKLFLIPYALIATGIAAYFAFSGGANVTVGRTTGDPFTRIPDFFGEYEKANKEGRRKAEIIEQWMMNPKLKALFPDQKQKLPPQLVTNIKSKNSVRVGDLEVTPLKIERRPVQYFTSRASNAKAGRAANREWLVLHVKLKNVSTDCYYHPTDPAFVRNAKMEGEIFQPYTRIEFANGKTFPGGPFPWRTGRSPDLLPWVQEQEKDVEPLAPGEERQSVILSIYEPELWEAVEKSKEPILWRVQFRCGVVPTTKGDVSVTGVVGIEFKKTDIVLAS